MLQRVNEGVALAVIAPVLLVNAWRIDFAAERAMLYGTCVLLLAIICQKLFFPKAEAQSNLTNHVVSACMLAAALGSLVVNALI